MYPQRLSGREVEARRKRPSEHQASVIQVAHQPPTAYLLGGLPLIVQRHTAAVWRDVADFHGPVAAFVTTVRARISGLRSCS